LLVQNRWASRYSCVRLSRNVSRFLSEVRVELPADLQHFVVGEAAAGGEIGDCLEVVACPPGRLQSSMRAVVSPTFLKRCTTLRGMKTMVPGPAVEV
jgi:hypothetical protein